MNIVILSGRLTSDPKVGENYTKFSLAVDRVKEGTDFLPCVCFGKTAEAVGKFLKKGTKILVEGHIQTGSYKRGDSTVYTTDIIVDRWEFAQSKSEEFMQIDDNDEGIPFR